MSKRNAITKAMMKVNVGGTDYELPADLDWTTPASTLDHIEAR
jgi:hypothetical protein